MSGLEKEPSRRQMAKELAMKYARQDPRFRCVFRIYDAVMAFLRRCIPCLVRCMIKTVTCCLISLDTFEEEDMDERRLMAPQVDEPPEEYKSRMRRLRRLKLDRDKKLEARNRALDYYGGIAIGIASCLFIYFILVRHHTIGSATTMALITLLVALILERSREFRCIIMLSVPLLFTNRGRSLVICFVLAILMAGPVKNTKENLTQLQDTLACGKRYLLSRTRDFMDENVLDKLLALDSIMLRIERSLKKFVEGLMELLERLRLDFLELVDSLERMFRWLQEVVDLCNANAMEPYENCCRLFDEAQEDCVKKLKKAHLTFLCELVGPAKQTCHLAKAPSIMCAIPSKVVTIYKRSIQPEVERLVSLIKEQLYCKINMDYQYQYKQEKSKGLRLVLSEIREDLAKKFIWLRIFSNIFSLLSLVITLWILSRSTLYYMRFRSHLDYDNMYIDQYIYEIERRRSQLNLRTVLPLGLLQRRHYMRPFDLTMNDDEIHKLCIAGTIWICIFNYIIFYLSLDYLLYRLCAYIRRQLDRILAKESLVETRIHFSDNGDKNQEELERRVAANQTTKLTQFYLELADTITGSLPNQTSASGTLRDCLPEVRKPDYSTYRCIGYFAVFTFFTVILEAYSLRMRHCIASLYYPSRARERAVWLYQRLLADKRSAHFLLRLIPFANRPANRPDDNARLHGKVQPIADPGEAWLENLGRKLCPRFLMTEFRRWGFCQEGLGCIICGRRCSLSSIEDQNNFIRCSMMAAGNSATNKSTVECNAIYCFDCFKEYIFNKCIICNQTIILDVEVQKDMQNYATSSTKEGARKMSRIERRRQRQQIAEEQGYGRALTFNPCWRLEDATGGGWEAGIAGRIHEGRIDEEEGNDEHDEDQLIGATPSERQLLQSISRISSSRESTVTSRALVESYWRVFINDLRMII